MSRFVLLSLYALIISGTANAYSGVHLMSGIGFSAPNVIDPATNVGNPQDGDIAFDPNIQGFLGYAGSTAGWVSLSPSSASFQVPNIVTYTSGTGNYTATAGVKYIRVRMVGGGGGGGGSGTSSTGGLGGAGGTSTFGSSLLTTTGGAGSAGTPGTATVNLPAVKIIEVNGNNGQLNVNNGSVPVNLNGPMGAATPIGIGGGNLPSLAGSNGSGYGSGGGGGYASSSSASNSSGAGGSSAGYLEAFIANPSGSYAYTVGGAGAAGTLGSSGAAGGSGAPGYIEITEYFQ